MSDRSATRIFVPHDAAALSVGADAVVQALLAANWDRDRIQITRTGSRGMLWLEPLVEVETPTGRIAYGPVCPSDVASLIAADFLRGGAHRLRLGAPDKHPFLARQDRQIFARCGIIDPLSLSEYEAHGGWNGLKRALEQSPAQIVEEITTSGLRGRGGAGFPTGIKWKTVLDTPAPQKYIVCNADEGDSGTYADRMIMEGDPFLLIEGMIIAGLAVGASQGYVYLRSEYPQAEKIFSEALARCRQHDLLGPRVLGSSHPFEIELRRGAGSYICGEETALLESLEGRRGIVRFRPPVPAVSGLWGKPTALNNVLTFAAAPWILTHGGSAYRDLGTGRSRGTLPFQLAGNIRHGGLVEKAFGLTLRELIEDYGGGTRSGRPIRAVQVGGPLGAYLPESMLDVPLDYEALAARDSLLGHGGVVVFDDTCNLAELARYSMEFCAIESCGKCTPCRIGSTRGVEVIDRIRTSSGEQRAQNITLLQDLCETMTHASLCALGGLTPLPVRSALKHFPEDFGLPRSNSSTPAKGLVLKS